MATYHFNLEVITPVHIGMGSEKDYIKGLDFIYNRQDKEYTIFSQNKLLNSIEKKDVNAVSAYLSSGNFSDFNDYIRNKHLLTDEIIEYTWQSDYESDGEIKRHIQDGMGRWIIPGSSLKGSIRGMLLSYLNQSHNNINEIELMGRINNNLMRFIQISDCVLDTTPGIYPVKIFSADPDDEGNWKHKRKGGHGEDFDSRGFVTYFEMLNDGVNSEPTSGSVRINWGNWGKNGFLFEKANGGLKKTPNLEKIFGTKGDTGIGKLIQIIKEHTDKFLKKEIEFFENYTNRSLRDESFFNELKWLKEENHKEENSCILRIGGNEGWHSITGDWKWKSFIDATEQNRNNITKGRQKAYKTRKMVFSKQKGDNTLYFSLPGFIKITLKIA